MTNKKLTNIVVTRDVSEQTTLEMINHIMRHRDSELEGVSVTYIGHEGDGPPEFLFYDPDIAIIYALHHDTGYVMVMTPSSDERVADVINAVTFTSERRKVRNWSMHWLYNGKSNTEMVVRPSSKVIQP